MSQGVNGRSGVSGVANSSMSIASLLPVEFGRGGLESFAPEVVSAFTRRWESLFDDCDAPAMAAYYASDAVVIATGTETIEGRCRIEQFFHVACDHLKATGVRRTVHVDDARTDGDLGYIRGIVVLHRPDTSTATTVRYVTLWQREMDGLWRITTDISSAAPGPR